MEGMDEVDVTLDVVLAIIRRLYHYVERTQI